MKPEAQALILCEQAFQQADCGKWHLIGIYDVILAQKLPATHAPFVVFWSLGRFHGESLVTVTVRDNFGAFLHSARGMIPKVPGPQVEYAFPLPPIKLEHAGSYMIELHVGDELLTVRTFHVRLVAAPADGSTPAAPA